MPRYSVSRSIEIDASPQTVFEAAADYGSWTKWSPWLCAEPNADVTVTEDASSVGSVYAWNGEIVGQGEIEHRHLEPGRLIEDEIRFVRPFKSRADVSFELKPAGDGTRITWNMDGSLPWFLFWMRSSMKAFIGMDYDRGLRMLKDWVETGVVPSQTTIRGVAPVGPLRMAGVRRTCALKDIGPSMEQAVPEAQKVLTDNGLRADGEMISVYHHFDLKKQMFDFTCGFVLPDSAGSVPDDIASWSLPATRGLCVEHRGAYDHLGNAWSAANMYARYKKLRQSRVGSYEVYRNDPATTPSDELLTEIVLPLR